ncbi:MAG TPA: M15 family metallopeptidase [Nevskiaceae bacterium]|nr:M15 family metallopeptidase [Nevskiaceae bacterium]
MSEKISATYRKRIAKALASLGIDPSVPDSRKLALFAEARRLAFVGLGTDGRDKMLEPKAARAWLAMRKAAQKDGGDLLLVSAFRSVDFQIELIRGKLAKGRTLDEVLKVNAPPGYSEHHTGCAVDVGFKDCPPLDEAFAYTPAFAWLRANAQRFGFTMSYPRGNPEGYLYEPWHWRFRP